MYKIIYSPKAIEDLQQWSRTITKKHRLIYEIFETEVYIDVLSAG